MRAKAWGVLLLALGCGGTEKPGNPAATGGQGAGGTNPGSAGSSASSSGNGSGGIAVGASGNGAGGSGAPKNPIGVVLGDSPAEACIAYAWAVCSRREECRGTSEGSIYNCTSATLGCPDLSLSPGATRTVEVLKACAATYVALPCEEVRAEKLPACVTPGTRMRGEDCLFASQCSSLSCAQADSCGQCGVRAAKGESCAQFDVECEVGTTCNVETDLCEPPLPFVDTTPGPNEACVPNTGCKPGSYCKTDGLGGGVCAAQAKTNESCAEAPCAFGDYCAAADSICREYPLPGLPCGLDRSGSLICDGRGICEAAAGATSGTCKPMPKAGEPCIVPSDNPANPACYTAGLHCDTKVSPPICKGAGIAGEVCLSHNDCLGLSTCGCADPLAADCPDKRCIELKVAGHPCTAPNTRCHPGFECVGGVCQAITLRGDFSMACGI